MFAPLGIDELAAQVLLDQAVGPLDVEDLADQVMGTSTDTTSSRRTTTKSTSSIDGARVALELAGHGQVLLALDVEEDKGVEARV